MTDHLRIELDANLAATEGVWDRSDFPHPLVTCDYNSEGQLYAVEIMGPLADAVASLVGTVIAYLPASMAKKA